MSIEELRAKVLAATAGEWSVERDACAQCDKEGTAEWNVYGEGGVYGGNHGLLAEEGDAHLIVAAVNIAKRLCTDEIIEAVALDIAGADAEQTRWGRAIMPLDIARVFARAAIQAILGEGPSTLGVGVETRDG